MNGLIVLAKYWQPGQVKTRLAASIGLPQAAELHRVFLATTLTRLAKLADFRQLAFTPDDRQACFRMLAPASWQLAPQVSGDLGARIQAALCSALEQGLHRVVLLGSDTPHLPTRLVDEAFACLESVDVVLGPSEDGGYYLLGARIVPPIFDDMPWGQSNMLASTEQRLQTANIPYHLLPAWYDIDHLEDVRRLQTELDTLGRLSPDQQALATALDQAAGHRSTEES